jgi:putative transposase
MPQSLHALGTHIVFSTKDRRPLLAGAIRTETHAYMARILETLGCRSMSVGGVDDHVHVLCWHTKAHSSSELMRVLKSDSSKFIKTLPGAPSDFGWQRGYGLFGVSPNQMAGVRVYVETQEEHHRKETFQEEFRRLLIEAGIDFDERYVWD